MPSLALAAIISVALSRLVDVGAMVRLWKTDTLDFLVFTLTFMVTIFVSVAMGLLAGIAASGVLAFVRSLRSRSPISLYKWEPVPTSTSAAELVEGVPASTSSPTRGAPLPVPGSVWRRRTVPVPAPTTSPTVARLEDGPPSLEGRPDTAVVLRFGPDLVYLHADRFRAHFEEALVCYTPSVVVIDGLNVADADASGLSALYASALHAARVKGVVTIVCGLEPHVLGMLLRHVRAGGETVKRVDALTPAPAGPVTVQVLVDGNGEKEEVLSKVEATAAAATTELQQQLQAGGGGDIGVVLAAGVLVVVDTLPGALALASALSAWAVREHDDPSVLPTQVAQYPSSSSRGDGPAWSLAALWERVGRDAGYAAAPSSAAAAAKVTPQKGSSDSSVGGGSEEAAATAAAAVQQGDPSPTATSRATSPTPFSPAAEHPSSTLPLIAPGSPTFAAITSDSRSSVVSTSAVLEAAAAAPSPSSSISGLSITSTVLLILQIVRERSLPRRAGLFSSLLSQSVGGLLGANNTTPEEAAAVAERDPAAPSWLSRRRVGSAAASRPSSTATRAGGRGFTATLGTVEGIPPSNAFHSVEQARRAREPLLEGATAAAAPPTGALGGRLPALTTPDPEGVAGASEQLREERRAAGLSRVSSVLWFPVHAGALFVAAAGDLRRMLGGSLPVLKSA